MKVKKKKWNEKPDVGGRSSERKDSRLGGVGRKKEGNWKTKKTRHCRQKGLLTLPPLSKEIRCVKILQKQNISLNGRNINTYLTAM